MGEILSSISSIGLSIEETFYLYVELCNWDYEDNFI